MSFHWFPFLVYAIATAATPGPNNIMSMSIGGRLGFRKAIPFNLGIWGGFSVVMILCTVISSLLLAIIPAIKLPMQILGACYILYLAWGALRSHTSTDRSITESGARHGFLLQFINPKIYIYGILSMNAYILPVYQGKTAALIYFALLLAFIGFIFTLLWSAFGSAFRWLFSSHAKIVNSATAFLLVICAISLFLE